MNLGDSAQASDNINAMMNAGAIVSDDLPIKGILNFECHDADGNLLWQEIVENLVTTVGKNQILNSAYSSSAYTSAEYMGLISSVGFTALAAGDTMSSHAGWNEAQNTGTNTPSYGTVRPTLTYGAASGGVISTSSTNSFVATSAGTVQGAFVVGGSGASATVANTGGVLMNEGTLGTPQPVISGNTVTIGHTLTLT